jgi:hypothetical protein
VAAAEGDGERARAPEADRPRDLGHGARVDAQQVGGAVEPDAGQVLAERRPADLGEDALELTPRGGHAPRDIAGSEVLRVLALQDGDRVIEDRAPRGARRGCLAVHPRSLSGRRESAVKGAVRDQPSAGAGVLPELDERRRRLP